MALALRWIVCLLALSGCGQRSLPAGSDAGPETDGAPIAPRPDGAVSADDTSNITTANCGALAGFAGGKRLTSLRTRKALFSPKLDRVVIVSHKDNAPGDLHAVELPSGKVTLLDTDINIHTGGVAWLGQGTRLLAGQSYDHKTHRYTLRLVDSAGGGAKTLAEDVCSHKASPDGARVFIVRDCTDQQGTLELLDPMTGAATWLADGVYVYGLVLSPDGKRLGFITDQLNAPPDCQRGYAKMVDSSGKVEPAGQGVVMQSLQWLDNETLLFGMDPDCKDGVPGFQLVSCDRSTCTLVGKPHDYGYGFHLDETRYAASPDGSLVLGAWLDPQGLKNQLFAVRTDGSGETLIAGDLFPFVMVAAVFEAWTFTKSGKHVVYTHLASSTLPPYTMGLTAVSTTGAKSLSLASDIFGAAYQVSPTREEVAFIGYTSSTGVMRLELGFIDTGATVQVMSSNQQLGQLRYLPDGRGLLLLETGNKTVKGTSLLYAPRDGSGVTPLGQWEQSLMMSQRYEVDPSGCVALYDTDLGGGGTHLVLLPR